MLKSLSKNTHFSVLSGIAEWRTFGITYLIGIIMTLYKYNKLGTLEQHTLIWELGTLLGSRVEGGHKILLFQLFSFYVEVYFGESEKTFIRLRPFKSTHQLKEYLAGIDISGLFDGVYKK